MAGAVYIPMDARRPVIKNTDTFTARASGRAAATPEALYGLFPVGFTTDERTERQTMRFYLDRVEPFVGSPMLSPRTPLHAPPSTASPTPTARSTPAGSTRPSATRHADGA